MAILNEPNDGRFSATKLQMPIEIAILGEGDIIEESLLPATPGPRCDANMLAISEVQVACTSLACTDVGGVGVLHHQTRTT